MLKVGEDSYLTVADADDYVAKNYLSTNSYRKRWEQLTDEDKESLLRSSTSALDSLKFVGAKRSRGQKLQFPRVTALGVLGPTYGYVASQFYDIGLYDTDAETDGGLFAVRQACADNALVAASVEEDIIASTVDGIRGITSKHVGPVSESYNLSLRESRGAKRGLYSQKLYSLLSPWLADSFMSL